MSAWVVGQEIIRRRPAYKSTVDEPVTITRVGRKYVYVPTRWAGGEEAYDAETGYEKGVTHNPSRIFTPEGLVEHDRRRGVLDQLERLTRDYLWRRRLSTEAAERIVAILVGDGPA